MSLHKLCLFTALALIVAFVVAGSKRRINEIDLAHAQTPLQSPELHADVWKWQGQPISKPNRVEKISAGRQILPADFLPLQFRNPNDLAAGKLLVASRGLADPNFAKTVVLLAHYDAQGVVGLILNRRTTVPLSRALVGLKGAKDRSDPIYLGGPVDNPALFALFHSPARVEGAEHVFGGVYLISAKTVFEQTISTRPDPSVFHVYLGYAGWNSNQLRKEVQLGAWFIFPAELTTIFNSDPDTLWQEMIRKTELQVAAAEPANPTGSPQMHLINPTHLRRSSHGHPPKHS